MGPAIVVPFDREVVVAVNNVNQVQTQMGRMVLFPETGRAVADLRTEVRKRGLQDVPVYTAVANFDATFDPCLRSPRAHACAGTKPASTWAWATFAAPRTQR